VAAGDFFTGPFENSLRPGEWVVEVRWPRRAAGTGYAFEEFARRRGDYGLCGVAAVVRRSSGAARASLAYLGMGPAPARLEIDYDAGSPRAPVDSSVERLDPPDDIHASASYRLHLARRLGERAVRRALEAAEAAP
jgi:carbon-monoxide dehydrogenase medium subunit